MQDIFIDRDIISLGCITTFLLIVCASTIASEGQADPLAVLTPLAQSTQTIDVGSTALAIAHAVNPAVNVDASATSLDALAKELQPAIARAADPRENLAVMGEYIYKRWGFADRSALPAEVFVSFADVLEKKQWNCFAISVLYIALGERIGLPFELVSGRGHVCVQLKGTNLFVETTDGGKVYEGKEYLAQYLPFPCVDPNEYKAVSSREAVAVLLTQTGGAVLAQGKPDFGLACFQHALDFDPNYAEAHAALGFHYAQVGPASKAIEQFEAAIKADPKLAEAHGGLGGVLFKKLDFEGAAKALRNAVAICDKYPEPLFNLGEVLFNLGDSAGSIDALQKYIALVPDDPDAFIRLAYPLEDSGRLDEALASYAKALKLNPESNTATYNSGAILEKLGRLDDARNMYEKAIAISADDWLAYAGLGRIFTATDKFGEAERAFKKSIEIDATYSPAWIDFAKLDRKRGAIDSAIQKLQHAIELDAKEAESHIAIAELYLQRQETAKAAEHAAIAAKLGEPLPEPLQELLPADAKEAKP